MLTSFLQRARVIAVSHSSALLAYNEKQIEFDWMEAAPGDCGQALFSGGFLFFILTFLQFSRIDNLAEMNFFILSLLFKAPGVCDHIRGSLLRRPRLNSHFILNAPQAEGTTFQGGESSWNIPPTIKKAPGPSFFMSDMIYVSIGQARLTATGLLRP